MAPENRLTGITLRGIRLGGTSDAHPVGSRVLVKPSLPRATRVGDPGKATDCTRKIGDASTSASTVQAPADDLAHRFPPLN